MKRERRAAAVLLPIAGQSRAAIGAVPFGMSRLEGCTHDQVDTLQRVATEIFCDMSNAGYPLQVILGSIYLSGLQHASTILAEKHNEDSGKGPTPSHWPARPLPGV